MATVNLGPGFAELDGWPGNLLNGEDATVTTKTATTFTFTFPAGHEFAGYSVTVKGTGFVYDGSEPIGGTMTGITFKDASGATILSITGLAAGTPASDLNLFYANVFGWDFPDGGSSGSQQKNAWSQILMGNDVVNGTAGDDYRGFPGVNAGNDVFNMGDGSDWVLGGMGNDTVNGGDGYDALSFEETHWNEGIPMVRGINANLNTGVVLDPYGFKDKVTGIEMVVGSSYADVFIGDANNNTFTGGRGKDTMNGGAGDFDRAQYQDEQWFGATRGIVADLTAGTIKDGFGTVDTVVSMEQVWGTRFNDVFKGSGAQEVFSGGNGKDSFDGKGGNDYVHFDNNFADENQTGINLDMSKASNQVIDDGFGNTETMTNIEGVTGSNFNDKIKGNSGTNFLAGADGRDTLTGNGGNDHFEYWDRDHMDDGDVITDFNAASGADQDVLVFFMSDFGASTTLTLVNGTAATQAKSTFIFDAATDTLYWDADGTGGGARTTVAVLQGVSSLSAANFDLI